MRNMELQAKLEILADAAKYDASCASSGALRVLPETRDAEYGRFVEDLKITATYIRDLR